MFFRVAAIVLIAASCAFCGPVWSLPFDQSTPPRELTGDTVAPPFTSAVPANLYEVCSWIIERTATVSLDSRQSDEARTPDWGNYDVDASAAAYSGMDSPADGVLNNRLLIAVARP